MTGEVERLLAEALERGASDVHLEPGPGGHAARLRVDGALLPALGGALVPASEVERLADQARLLRNPSDRPRVGALELEVGGSPVRFRASALTAVGGLLLSLHRLTRVGFDLVGISMEAPERERLERALEGHGRLVLLCGPAGSGKTTALYAALAQAAARGRLVVSAEQPVEARVPGVHQLELDAERGLDPDAALPALLAQGADVVGLDELRTWKDARAAVRVALAGRTCLATVSASDGTTAVSRLLNLGAEPFLLAATLRLAVGCRLLHRLCPACRTPTLLSAAEREALRAPGHLGSFVAPGCAACAGTGREGRLAVFEAVEYGPELTDLMLQGASSAELRGEAIRQGQLRTLRSVTWNKLDLGEVGADEVLRQTPADPPPGPVPPGLPQMDPALRERLREEQARREGEGQP